MTTALTTAQIVDILRNEPNSAKALEEYLQTSDLKIKVKMTPVNIRLSGKDLRGALNVDNYRLKRPE